jgi:hypothetical protein
MNDADSTCRDQVDDGSPANLTYSGTPLKSYHGVGYQRQPLTAFDGSDDYAEGTAATPANYRTFFVWVYPEPITGDRYVAAQGGAATYSWGIVLGGTGVVQVTIWQNGGSNYMSTFTAPGLVCPRKWHMIGFTLDAVTPILRIYIDGAERASTASVTGSYGTTATLAFGRRPDNSGTKFSGLMGHAAYWSSASATSVLSPYTMTDLYRAGRWFMAGQQTNRFLVA